VGLAADLSYTHREPSHGQRLVQVFASSRPGAAFFSKTLARTDRVLARVTDGRVGVTGPLAGLPALVLTSTGRKTGQPRRTHLIAIPVGETLALLGTNFGQRGTPAWVLNLEADPRATVTYQGRSREVVARPATDSEQAQVLATSLGIYGGYVKYQQRISGRALRIFVLEPRGT
jgi:deazaflavin-dependent oxidoreductase (nitroreductase family)